MAFESILSVPFFLTLPFGGVKKLTCLWVAVLATTTLGRHVLINLKLINMAFCVVEGLTHDWAPCSECKA
jgi:hypothetical protein